MSAIYSEVCKEQQTILKLLTTEAKNNNQTNQCPFIQT